jgi:hypothetical protein
MHEDDMSTRLTLADGQSWIDVKDKLKVRDDRAVSEYATLGFTTDGKEVRLDPERNKIGAAAVRILNWRLASNGNGESIAPYPAGQPFEARCAAIDDLYADTFQQIVDALNIHFAEKPVPEKNAVTQSGEPDLSTSLPSARE